MTCRLVHPTFSYVQLFTDLEPVFQLILWYFDHCYMRFHGSFTVIESITVIFVSHCMIKMSHVININKMND